MGGRWDRALNPTFIEIVLGMGSYPRCAPRSGRCGCRQGVVCARVCLAEASVGLIGGCEPRTPPPQQDRMGEAPFSESAMRGANAPQSAEANLLAHDKHNPSAPWPAEKALSLYSLHSPSAAPGGSAFRVVYTRPGRPGTSVNIPRLCRALHERQHGTRTGAERFWIERCNRSV
jgi:hypothetical protein